MATSSLSSAAVTNATQAAGLSMNDLLKVLMTELTYQDPMKPDDTKDFLTQVAQFTNLDTTRQLNDNITQLLSLQSLNQSVGLIGKTVDATTSTGTVSGTVTALSLATGQPELTLTDASGAVVAGISLSQIQTVR
jgi:flagellar basal-body rod modification protein FlgD